MIVYDSREPFAIKSVIQIQYFSVIKMLLKKSTVWIFKIKPQIFGFE